MPRPPPEILAPAGGREPFLAALNAGADAVYLGLQSFNARATADNFTVEDLEELLPLARRYEMRVLVTVNTLLAQGELPEAMELLATLDALRVDGIIVQDPGVVRMARRQFPTLALHASTQMAIHSPWGVEQAATLGFKRVVLARELTVEEIDDIARTFPDVELEVFCHGSLCTSYSGLCLLSSMESGHSGNRGRCRYPCRRRYELEGETTKTGPGAAQSHLLSMRDLELPTPLLARLVATGAHALKIEGRKKDAQYVQTVVRLYRQRLDEIFGVSTLRATAPPAASLPVHEVLQEDLAFGFRRRPTQLYLAGRRQRTLDPDHPTHLGVVVGPINAVRGRRIRVQPSIPLERYDGLRLSVGDGGFSLRRMWVDGRSVPTAHAGHVVEIEVPGDCPLPAPGDELLKVRSADLKRRTAALSVVPQGARLRRTRPVDGSVALVQRGELLTITAGIKQGAATLVEESIQVAAQRPRGPSSLRADLRKQLALFGEAGFQVEPLEIHGDHDWFVPRRLLKELKARLARSLPGAYTAWADERLELALDSLSFGVEALAPGNGALHVRLDSVEGLLGLGEFLATHPETPIGEVVVAPRVSREGLADATPWIDAWPAFSATHPGPLRLAMPAVVRADEEPDLRRWLQTFARGGLAGRYELANPASLVLLERLGLPLANGGALTGDATLNALNHEAVASLAGLGLHRITLPLEGDLPNLRELLRHWPTGGIRPQVALFADPSLLITEACVLAEVEGGCPGPAACSMRDLLLAGDGHRYRLSHQHCRGVLRDVRPLSITHLRDELAGLGVRDFCVELLGRHGQPAVAGAILEACVEGRAIPNTHSGNMDRKLL